MEHTKYFEATKVKVKMFHVLKGYRLHALSWCMLEYLLQKSAVGLRQLRVADVRYQEIVKNMTVLINRGYVNHLQEGLVHKYYITPVGKQVYYEILDKLKADELTQKYTIRIPKKKKKTK